jgi:uncharacterized protein YkwD
LSSSPVKQFRYALAAGATAVVIGVGFTVVGINSHANEVAGRSTALDAAQPPVDLTGEASQEALVEEILPPSTPPGPSASASSPAPVKSSPSKAATKKPASKPTTRQPTTKQTIKGPGGGGDAAQTSGSVLDQVLAHINATRKDENLPALTLDANLSKAAAIHNQLCVDADELSHKFDGEEGIGARFKNVSWRSAGENIGFNFGGSGDAGLVEAANKSADGMLAEVPPNDGHRKNLLSSGFTKIGLSVIRSGNGRIFVTQDFVG